MRIEFHPAALVEFQEASHHYAEKRPGLENRFIDAIQSVLARIAEAPRRHRVLAGDVRRCLTHIFPYAVLYTVEPDHILVVAVMHCRRKPDYWSGRV
ncbi:type II toxin-antitoxin system RelE/ParE family toxin [Nocardia alni]|uniref:type II toxin-antitoxin system RelE/ParE family toxin n=1 Tax=Nocardia alni TaxID=2815723 RepID=UPI001C23C6FA|nr:type II toxin-antitoxin system RelE/ParE family toxin [Nocardia alni]